METSLKQNFKVNTDTKPAKPERSVMPARPILFIETNTRKNVYNADTDSDPVHGKICDARL
jgi:hypothetical protein